MHVDAGSRKSFPSLLCPLASVGVRGDAVTMHDDIPRLYATRPRPVAPSLPHAFAGELNPAQLGAATHPGGPLLIIAGAGTGKTRTLIHRLAHLLATGVPADRILLLTFTRRAAQEMLSRAER